MDMRCKRINIWVTLSCLIKKPSIFQNYRWHIHSASLNLISILQNICLKQLCLMRKACLCCVLFYYRCNSSHRRLHESRLRRLSCNPRVRSFWTLASFTLLLWITYLCVKEQKITQMVLLMRVSKSALCATENTMQEWPSYMGSLCCSRWFDVEDGGRDMEISVGLN